MKVYINYPNPKFSIHHDPLCAEVRKRDKSGQRCIRINIETISTELQNFTNKKYTFNSNAESNDMWLDIEFNDIDFEESLLKYIRRLIGKFYTPFREAELANHC